LTQNNLFKTLNRSDEVTIMCFCQICVTVLLWSLFGTILELLKWNKNSQCLKC